MAIAGPLKLNFQLLGPDGPAIGPGKALVMEAVDREGSIAAAGRALGMSYRRIWLLVESLNRQWRDVVVETRIGGGARLSPFGRELLDTYRNIERRMVNAAAGPDLDWLIAARADPD